MGAPTKYSDKLADEICGLISWGESVRQISQMPNMPSERTIYYWLNSNQEFLQKYARAREAQADYFAEEILEIADDGTNDWMERRDDDGAILGWRENGEALQRSKLRVDTRKWLMSKLAPKKYGDRSTTDVNLSGDLELIMRRIDGGTKTKG